MFFSLAAGMGSAAFACSAMPPRIPATAAPSSVRRLPVFFIPFSFVGWCVLLQRGAAPQPIRYTPLRTWSELETRAAGADDRTPAAQQLHCCDGQTVAMRAVDPDPPERRRNTCTMRSRES